MADEEDKWSEFRRGEGGQEGNKKAQEGFLKHAQDNPLINVYRWITGQKEKEKPQDDEG
jgi:hypothetical protein